MNASFPSDDWLNMLEKKLNEDEKYNRVARNWEGDISITIEPSGKLTNKIFYYIGLWHGKCTRISPVEGPEFEKPEFKLAATFDNITRILKGKLDPMQAMLTRKLKVQGNMAYMMRNVPVVLDFVRCAREITGEILE